MSSKTVVLLLCIFLLTTGASVHAQSADDWFERGVVAEDSRKYDNALNAYSEAIALDPSFAEPYLRRGALNFMLSPSKALEVIQDLDRAIDLDAENGEAFYTRARIHFYVLNNEAGRRDMMKAAGLGHEGARSYLESPASRRLTGYVHLGSYIQPEGPPMAFFEFDKADLDDTARDLLDSIAHALRNDLADVVVYVVGHTDSQGTEEYNLSLSQNRAQAVKDYLQITGNIAEERLIMRYYGKSRPLASNDTDTGRAMNRRVELMALKR